MKKLFSVLLSIAIVAAVIVACKDNFNESDFLKLQSTLKTQQDSAKLNQQIRQLNAAGALLSFTIQVVEDRTPLAGVDVTVSNDVTSGSVKVTTDANGNAVFPKASVGSNTIIVSKSGYISSTAIVDFGSLAAGTYYTTVTGANGAQNIIPLKQAKSVLLPIFSTGGTGSSTATIRGKVTIETDVTNKTPEIPQNLTIRANYSFGNAFPAQGSGVTITSYSFNQAGIGVATVDNTTGAYSMTVPATAAGMTMSLLLPTIETNQKIAVTTLDGTPIATGPQYRNVPTSFGPTITADTSIPSVAGAKAVFPNPPTPGAGLSFNFSPVPGPLSTFTFDTYNKNYQEGDPSSFDVGNSAFQLTSRGSGYTSSPTVTLTGGGTNPVPTQAKMRASIEGFLTGLLVGNGGANYVQGEMVTVYFRFKDNTGANYEIRHFTSQVTVSGGAITSMTLPTFGDGIDPATPFRTVKAGDPGFNVVSFDAIITGGTGAGATITPVFTGIVDAIKLENAGSNYTSAPTITFTGGGSSNQATMMVKEYRTQWYITPNNTTNTSPYPTLPSDVQFEFQALNQSPNVNGDILDQFNGQTLYMDNLTVSGGNVVQADPTKIFRSKYISSSAPRPLVTPKQAITAKADVAILSSGEISLVTATTIGAGYNSDFNVTIQPTTTGAPGSGAVLQSGFAYDPRSKEYTWGGATVLNPGTGYLVDLNQQNNAPLNPHGYGFTGNVSNFTIKTNDVQIFNFSYGTGKRKENVN